MARYSIDGQTLTNIADSIREKLGKSEGVPATVEAVYEFSHTGTTTASNWSATVGQITVPGASKVLVKDIVITCDTTDELYFRIGYSSTGTNYSYLGTEYRYGDVATPNEIEATTKYSGLVYIGARHPYTLGGGIEISITATVIGLDANGNVLVNKEVMLPYLITPEQMVDEISDMAIVPSEALNLTGNCQSRFSGGTCDWLINLYGEKMTTYNITGIQGMFNNSKVVRIPFDINTVSVLDTSYATYMFAGCSNLENVPKINGKPKISEVSSIFSGCYRLRNIPEDIGDWFDWSYLDNATSTGSFKLGTSIFQGCYSLRSVPMGFLSHDDPSYSYNFYCMYNNLFSNCYALDEIVGLPIPRPDRANWTSNYFDSTFKYCYHIKNMTFATNADGSPIQVKWKNQTVDLSNYVGYSSSTGVFTNHNSGITADKEVKDDATYQALKNDPDWFSCNVSYSRYNHDSAVATINSLPDTTSSGGTNTIKFKGTSGSATDGGAINTLTEEEIAVATAKGWTVSLV